MKICKDCKRPMKEIASGKEYKEYQCGCGAKTAVLREKKLKRIRRKL